MPGLNPFLDLVARRGRKLALVLHGCDLVHNDRVRIERGLILLELRWRSIIYTLSRSSRCSLLREQRLPRVAVGEVRALGADEEGVVAQSVQVRPFLLDRVQQLLQQVNEFR